MTAQTNPENKGSNSSSNLPSKAEQIAMQGKTSNSDSHKAPNKQTNKGRKRATLAIILVLLLTGAVIALGQYQYDQNQKIISQLQSQVASLNKTLESSRNETQKQAQANNQQVTVQIEQQQKSIKSLQLAIADLKGRRPNDWLLAEADYLTKMAGRKLFLEHDVESATQLMETADQRIAALNDPSLVPLRKAIAQDITTLKALPLIDKEGLILKLIGLQQQVEKLPLANALLPKQEQNDEQLVSGDIYDWQTNLMTSLKDFADHFITFRVREGNSAPLLSPDQHFYLQENIKAKLETAIKGVYAENNEVYQTSLNVALDWSTKFFNKTSLPVQKFEKSIRDLSKQNIQVEYPIKLVSQQPLTDVINERLRRSVISSGKEK